MNTILKKIIWPIVMIPPVYLAIVWNRLPERIAMQFDFRGNVSRYGSKTEMVVMVIVLSVVSLLIFFLIGNIYRIDPKKYAAENKERLQRIGFATAVFMVGIQCLVIFSATHNNMQMSGNLVFAAVGLLFSFLGNYLPNLKPNYFAGFRLPWTLENPDNWKKTHHLAGRLWFAGGILITIVCLFVPMQVSIIFFFVITAILVLIPCIFSYRYYKQQKSN